MSETCVIGVDIGTSGVRSVVMDHAYQVLPGGARCAFSELEGDPGSPVLWWQAVLKTLEATLKSVNPASVIALCVDGTSGTVLPIDKNGEPMAAPLMYNDAVSDKQILHNIAHHMPATSAAGGSTSGLAKALMFAALKPHRIVHQADWIVGKLTEHYGYSDANNALKTGYDAVAQCWPDWIQLTGFEVGVLPDVVVPGTPLVPIDSVVARGLGLGNSVQLISGTTDGCASFLATGASETGDAVTALGSTITLKILSDKPIYAPEYGVYSHLVGDQWLAGGASNSGGKVLEQFFNQGELDTLSARIDTSRSSGLDFYPLPGVGERFPVSDPTLQPRLQPKPDDDVVFLQALLEGMAGIEVAGYKRLCEKGASALRSVRTVGGGARSEPWSAIRQAQLESAFPLIQFPQPASTEAAAGTARLAVKGATAAQLW